MRTRTTTETMAVRRKRWKEGRKEEQRMKERKMRRRESEIGEQKKREQTNGEKKRKEKGTKEAVKTEKDEKHAPACKSCKSGGVMFPSRKCFTVGTGPSDKANRKKEQTTMETTLGSRKHSEKKEEHNIGNHTHKMETMETLNSETNTHNRTETDLLRNY